MSVIGIDFGNESCYIAAAKAGGIETLANDYSLRATPSCVAFDGKKRIIGVAAKNQQVTNMKNTICGFKRLLGRRYNDPHVQDELQNIPAKVEAMKDGSVGIKVNYLDEVHHFTPEQLTAMLFTKLKETSAEALRAQVNDCVISCPIYFTNAERQALLDAAHIANLNVLRLINDTTATALSYGFYKTDLPEDKPRNVIFVDCGNSSLQVGACSFTKGKLRMVANAWERVGGRDFDAVLGDHFAKEFNDRYKINAKTNPRAYLRLLTEIEKLKKQMSANSTKLPLNIECFMEDVDVSSSMQRADMEELCGHIFKRVEETFRKLLHDTKWTLDDIHSVEIVGGSSRIPAIKHLIEQVFGKPASTTLNQDESVSRGAALQCAIMSPAVRVREFGVTDIQQYAVKACWEREGSTQPGDILVFPAFHAAPFSRLLTMNRKAPFTMTVQYAERVPYPDLHIGKWFIADIQPNEHGEPVEVKVKVRINIHGIVTISNAAIVEKREVEEAATAAAAEQAAGGNDSMDQDGPPQPDAASEASNEGGEKKKKSTKLIDLRLEAQTHGFTAEGLKFLAQEEAKMIGNDAKETQRIDAKNGLEEFVYDMRNKLQGGSLERYVVEKERQGICDELNQIENWLYEDGEDCDRETYVDKLKALRGRTDAIKERAENYETCPALFEELKAAIHNARNAVNEFKNRSPKYDHLTETEFINIAESADKAEKWFNQNWNKFTQSQRHVDSAVKANDLRHEIQTLNTCVLTVINRPKPKPKPAKEGDQPQNGDATDKNATANSNSEESTMDVE